MTDDELVASLDVFVGSGRTPGMLVTIGDPEREPDDDRDRARASAIVAVFADGDLSGSGLI